MGAGSCKKLVWLVVSMTLTFVVVLQGEVRLLDVCESDMCVAVNNTLGQNAVVSQAGDLILFREI
jgi:hypothetical protein